MTHNGKSTQILLWSSSYEGSLGGWLIDNYEFFKSWEDLSSFIWPLNSPLIADEKISLASLGIFLLIKKKKKYIIFSHVSHLFFCVYDLTRHVKHFLDGVDRGCFSTPQHCNSNQFDFFFFFLNEICNFFSKIIFF